MSTQPLRNRVDGLVLPTLVVLFPFGLFHRQLTRGGLQRLWCQIPCLSMKHGMFVQCFKCIHDEFGMPFVVSYEVYKYFFIKMILILL